MSNLTIRKCQRYRSLQLASTCPFLKTLEFVSRHSTMFGFVILRAIFQILPYVTYAHSITIPQLSGIETLQRPLTDDDGIDITIGSDFSGLMTFANLPYVNCFKPSYMDPYDIAIIGAPFDTVSSPRRLAYPVRNVTEEFPTMRMRVVYIA